MWEAEDIIRVITAITALVAAVGGILAAKRAGQARHELLTMNQKTIGILASEDETRRIEAVPVMERTPGEQRHLLDIPPVKRKDHPSHG